MSRLIPVLSVLVLLTVACRSEQEKIGSLIVHVKTNDEYTGCYEIFNEARALSKYGVKALPALLMEFETTSSSYRRDLAIVLALIPAPERDEAFLKALEGQPKFSEENESETVAHGIMISTLACAKNTGAIPVIGRLAANPKTPGYVRSSAVAALNTFGEPLPPLNPITIQYTTSTLAITLQQSEFRGARAALQAMCDQVFHDQFGHLSTDTLRLTKAEIIEEADPLSDVGSTCFLTSQSRQMLKQIDRTGNRHVEFRGEGWHACFSFFNDHDAFVSAFIYTDPTEIGFLGRIVKRNGRWLVTEWQMIMYKEDPTLPRGFF